MGVNAPLRLRLPAAPAAAALAALAALAGSRLAAQKPTPFQEELTKQLKNHQFFRNVSFDLDASHAPFLFCLQNSLRRDETDYDIKVVNNILPFLTELAGLFDATYCKPQGLLPRADASQFAIAILASRGLYDDYARATNDPFLHHTLAHYNNELRLAVTYRAFQGDASEERHSLLHEFVHAMQHAYSTTGRMTKPVWFNEGLADYRASGTNIAASLRTPELIPLHVDCMAFGYATPEGRRHVLPLADLVVPENYAQVVAAAGKHAGAEVNVDLALTMFYAQAEMTVRFLHEAADGRYRAGFLRYFKAVEGGASALAAFQDAFDAKAPEAMAAIEQDWNAWLGALLEKRLGVPVDLATGGGLKRAALAPPAAFDVKTLAWRPDEVDDRIAGARRTCMQGRYAAALQLLPETVDGPQDQQQRLAREKKRIAALPALCDKVVADFVKRGAAIDVDGVKGKVLRRDGDDVVLQVGKAERAVHFAPALLLREGGRLKAFALIDCWYEAYLRWLKGDTRADMKELLDKGFSTMVELRQDLTFDLDAQYGAEAVLLEALLRESLPDDRDAAVQALARLRAATAAAGPLLGKRKAAVEQFARALAERAFALDDAAAMGIHGSVQKTADGRLRIEYRDPAAAPGLDFAAMPPAEMKIEEQTRIAYDGPTAVRADGKRWSAIGCGLLRWAAPLTGPVELELEYLLPGEGSELELFFCRAPGRHLEVIVDGRIGIEDQVSRISDVVGKMEPIYLDKLHKLRVVHDGSKKVTVQLDGKTTAELPNVGNCVGGELLLYVRSSQPVPIHSLVVTGRLDPSDPPAVRERFVQGVLQQLWTAKK
jgi:hypothetical protein